MDYQKLDAALIAALVSAEPSAEKSWDPGDEMTRSDVPEPTFDVFIHTTHPLHADEAAYLTSLGVRGAAPRRRILTATLPAPAIAALSEAEWVRALRLSQALSLASPDNPLPVQPRDPDHPTRRPIHD